MALIAHAAVEYIDEHKEHILEDLSLLVSTYPCSSDLEKHSLNISQTAENVATLARRAGLENVQVLTLTDEEASGAPQHVSGQYVPPCVFGQYIHAGPDQPTVLFYAHLDVMPVGDLTRWLSDPLRTVIRNEPEKGGERMYGRGVADDKAGLVAILRAFEAVKQVSAGHVPINFKILFEGEEEIGSVHLPQYLAKHRDLLRADVLVLADTANLSVGVPSITYSLRGIVDLDVELKVGAQTVHSGMYGGPMLDAVAVLCHLLGTLHDEKGAIAVPGFLDGLRELSEKEVKNLRQIDTTRTEADFKKESGMLPCVNIAGHDHLSPCEKTWFMPAINVIGIDACPVAQSSNRILPVAKARISCRIAADQEPEKIAEKLQDHLRRRVRHGAEISFPMVDVIKPWACQPTGAAFEAAERALERGYGQKAVYVGCGGTIGFVEPFACAYGGIPALLVGVEDPYSNAHGENESLLLPDFWKATYSLVHLMFELEAHHMARKRATTTSR
mmetsp:Transcript_25040/g.43235  ORF Transcript_25040/g.43235 Transcript_25040/m.43235 type:complete len:501 (+) Transcript_25040:159-1661(+)|eukprot:CAMPEP_0196656280 /NCGR_PEP_ID=MMETSP1086-20130531/15449_1 /TAXON_ID=77921 /ORGANISM="Cyanoptyche  gloeocystis , Strain SAG4.97" /LENGTH=500 /DNA_ID=CAMNT_0041988979 /DNA_START=157 /DNA_END=1659 /DNA_ORIENTATION=+